MAFNEIKECCKGQNSLGASLTGKKINYVGKRHASRFLSDAYGKGIVRSQQESMNLRVGGIYHSVTSAKSFHAPSFVNFPGKDSLHWREAVYHNADYENTLGAVTVDWRNPQRRAPIMRNLVFHYGHRPRHN